MREEAHRQRLAAERLAEDTRRRQAEEAELHRRQQEENRRIEAEQAQWRRLEEARLRKEAAERERQVKVGGILVLCGACIWRCNYRLNSFAWTRNEFTKALFIHFSIRNNVILQKYVYILGILIIFDRYWCSFIIFENGKNGKRAAGYWFKTAWF